MNLWKRLTGRPSPHRVSEIAAQVASECHWDVWNRIVGRNGTLASLEEARGYIRVRASAIVSYRAGQVIQADHHAGEHWCEPVVAAALDVITDRLAASLLAQPQIQPGRKAA